MTLTPMQALSMKKQYIDLFRQLGLLNAQVEVYTSQGANNRICLSFGGTHIHYSLSYNKWLEEDSQFGGVVSPRLVDKTVLAQLNEIIDTWKVIRNLEGDDG